jgi:DNA replication protein DnaC
MERTERPLLPDEEETGEPVEEFDDYSDETPRPSPRYNSRPLGLGNVVREIYAASHRSRNQGRPPVLQCTPSPNPPPAFTCPDCGETHEYTKRETLRESKPSPVSFFLRKQCDCERRAAVVAEERAIIEKAEAQRNHIAKAVRAARTSLRLPDRFQTSSFENFDTERHTSQKAAFYEARAFAIEAAKHFCWRGGTFDLLPEEIKAGRVLPMPPAGVVFVGNTGNGKTHLAAAIANYLSGFGVRAVFENMETFIADVRRESFGTTNKEARFDAAKDADVLILDDMGMEHISASNPTYARSLIYRIVDYRYSRNLPIVITTTQTPEKLVVWYGEQGKAIVSRLMPLVWKKLSGPDGRKAEVGKNFAEDTNQNGADTGAR